MKSWLKILKGENLNVMDISLSVFAKPSARKTEVKGESSDGANLVVALASQPVDGAANECLIEFLSDVLDVRKSEIELVRGHTSRHKVLTIRNVKKEKLLIFDKI